MYCTWKILSKSLSRVNHRNWACCAVNASKGLTFSILKHGDEESIQQPPATWTPLWQTIRSTGQSAISHQRKPSPAVTPNHQPWSPVRFYKQDIGRATCEPATRSTFDNNWFHKEPTFQNGTGEAPSHDLMQATCIFHLAWPTIPVSCCQHQSHW